MTAATGTQAVDRAALLVSTVVESDEPVAFAELAEESGLPKSTVSRLLTALERTQLVERTEGGEYVAGGLFARFASRYESVELARVAQPVLRALGDITGETVNLGIPRGDTVLHVAQVDSTFLLGTRDWTGVEVPNHASALGKVLLASGVIRMTGSLIALTDRTITDRAELAAALDDVRRQGWAATADELEVGLAGVAVPVCNGHGEVVGALGISGPTPRLAGRHEALAQLLTDQAAQLTAVLGHSPKEGVA
ncbi:MAG: IclR family transcriptional regulator [Nocardioides sp.]|uniref:IclR family transcriptional regulator n=1 Tax=Nocardioides sp. TaxID=35761 RepID=UPI0039E3423B